jgi:uncharacterized membrane protein YjfL (UPF0719 family)
MAIIKYALNAKTSKYYNADEEINKGNFAVGFRRIGAHLGLSIGMMGAFSGTASQSFTQDFISTAIYGLIVTCYIITSLLITDKLALPGVDNNTQLKKGNTSVGIVEFSMLISTGILAFASVYGDGGTLLASMIYFAIGQSTLLAIIVCVEKTKKHNLIKSIEEGKISSGIYLGGKIIAYSLILKSAIAGNAVEASFTSLAIEYIVLAISGIILLYILEWILDLIILTATDVKTLLAEDKIVPSMIISTVKIGLALVLSYGVL